ncbi:MAG: YaiI/YqxD family protein [Bacillota bacterium]
MKIIVDADAAPREVLEICREVSIKFLTELWTVASFNHNISSINHIVVGNESQEADIKIMNITSRGDIVVTQDYGLAAMVLAKGASALSPWGRIFRQETIDFLLQERDIKAKYRRSGGRTKGPEKRSEKDNIIFKKSLYSLLGQKV